MKKLIFLLLILCGTSAHAQQNAPDKKAMKVKAAMAKAMGGKNAIRNISRFNYTIHKTSFSTDTTITRTTYALDLNRQHIRETQYTAQDTLTRWINEDGAWQLKEGNKTALPAADKVRLQRVFLTNFVPMLQNDSLVYSYKKQTVYKGRTADVVQVFTPQKKELIMDVFVDSKNGEILTSSRPDPKTGAYFYFADELDYEPIGKGVVFPLVYQIIINGKLVTEGKFTNIALE